MSDVETQADLVIAGPEAAITIRRDEFGIPHVEATTEDDAWFGMGYAAAQDRLWQMEYDRRRAVGRWAEVVGMEALPADRLARRLQLEPAARADVAAMSPPTRAMFDAYAAGVTAFLASGHPLPMEYSLTGVTPEPWEPWHSVVSFKIRHALMGSWQLKLAQAQLLAMVGAETFARLDARPADGSLTILDMTGPVRQLVHHALADLQAAARSLGFLAEAEAGSNSWAVHGSRTTTGKPVLCNDSHRQLDVPNVYWQVQVSYPGVNVAGGAFPGVPGFPHFAHNGSVAWNITHGMADTQDLYIEEFAPGDPRRYRTPAGWETATHHREEIAVRGAASVDVEVWRTRHGPIVHGDPRHGLALALRDTTTDAPCRTFEALRPMLVASTVAALFETQQPWVYPVNNLVAADTAGNIGYLLRGKLPMRSSPAHRRFPVPGWTDESEWVGVAPFAQMPRAINPPEGLIVTANNRVIPGDVPYIGDAFAEPFRAQRIRSRLDTHSMHTPAEIAQVQYDTVSDPARAWIGLCRRVGPFAGSAEQARTMLVAWDGDLTAESGPALLYGCFRRRIAHALFAPVAGPRVWEWLIGGEAPATDGMVKRWLAAVVRSLEKGQTAPNGRSWSDVLPEVLAAAWAEAVRIGGPEPEHWHWADHHRTNAVHTLAGAFPDRAGDLNPPSVGVGGDSDTVRVGSYALREGPRFEIMGLPVFRQVVDMAQSDRSWSVIPGGSSGSPGTSHYADQLELWRTGRLAPLRA